MLARYGRYEKIPRGYSYPDRGGNEQGHRCFPDDESPCAFRGEWKENYIGAEEYEKTVKHVLLFAYKNIGTSPEKVIFYYPQGTANPLAGITGIDHFEMREMGGINVGDPDIALDLELMGGNYNFVLLVNCESGLKKIREEHMIPDRDC